MMLKSHITNLVISIVLFFASGIVKNFNAFLFLLSISTLLTIIAVIKSSKRIKKDILFILEQNKPAEFFDVNHIRRIEYNYERGDEFKKLLRDTLITIRNGRLI